MLRQSFLVVIMFVFVQLWKTTYSWEGSVEISGFTVRQMIWYLALSESIAMGRPNAAQTTEDEVKSGTLAYALNKPYSYPVWNYAAFMAEAVLRFATSFAIAGSVTWLSVGPPPFSVGSSLAGAAAVTVAFSMDFCIQFCLGLLAFWTEDTWAFRFLYSRVLMIFGGMMLPLEVFPESLRKVASALPTSLVIYGPVRTFLMFSITSWLTLLVRQAGWLVASGGTLALLYSKGVRRVSVQGG